MSFYEGYLFIIVYGPALYYPATSFAHGLQQACTVSLIVNAVYVDINRTSPTTSRIDALCWFVHLQGHQRLTHLPGVLTLSSVK